jgi:hypothetical protein
MAGTPSNLDASGICPRRAPITVFFAVTAVGFVTSWPENLPAYCFRAATRMTPLTPSLSWPVSRLLSMIVSSAENPSLGNTAAKSRSVRHADGRRRELPSDDLTT